MALARLRTRGGILRPPTASHCFFADREKGPIPFLDEEDTPTKSVHFPASPVTTIQPVLNWIDDLPTTSSLPCPELDCSFKSTVATIKQSSSSLSPVLSPETLVAADANLIAAGPPAHIKNTTALQNGGVLPCQFDCEHCYDFFMRSGGRAVSAQEIYNDDERDRRADFLEVIAREMRAGGKRKRMSDDEDEEESPRRYGWKKVQRGSGGIILPKCQAWFPDDEWVLEDQDAEDDAKVQYDKYQASHQAPPVPPRPNQQYPGQQYQYPGQQYPGQQYQQQQQQQQYYPANPVADASAHYPAAAPHYFPGSHPPQQSSYQRPPPPPPPQQQYPQYGQPQYSQPQYGQPQYGQPQYGQPPYGQQPYDQQPYEQPQYAQPPYQSPYQPPFQQPPPIPTHPTALPHYWAPILDPSAAVSVNFEHKQGAGGWGNNEAQTYTADARNSFHTPNGALVLRAIADRNAPEGQQYTSARLVSRQPLARDRGFLQVRITAPSAKGIWPAFWLLPREPFTWPGDGEVDIFEAWNGVRQNHACLHWGHFNGEDWNKHRVVETPIPQLDDPNGRWYGFSWDQDGPTGRMVWYVDGMPVMKAPIPPGTRRLADFQIIINIAMGGNVNQSALPEDGQYEMVIHSLKLHEEPSGGWAAFERDWATAAEGRPM